MENNNDKNKMTKNTPVSAHPDPVVPNAEEKVQADHQHDASKSVHDGKQEMKTNPHSNEENTDGEVTYDDKVIQKIIGIALEDVDGLLTIDGGFFSNTAEKLVNTDNETAGIETEVGKKQVAVDMKVVVEYGKDIEKIFSRIKQIVSKEVATMTHLDVIEVNVKVTDITTKEQFEKDSETVQDKVTDAAKTTGEFASEQTDKAKAAINNQADKMKDDSKPEVQ